jgi:lipopolysaccharide transport system permease protein
MESVQQEKWSEIIKPSSSLLDFRFDEVWRYRDLLLLLVRREYVASYKQTILGPIWVFLQPILTSIMFVIVFGRIAKISTDGVPMLLFYLSGLTLWNYFAESLNKTATVFKDNASIFGKVYFPRLIMPLSIVVANLIKLGIQFLLFIVIWGYYLLQTNSPVHPNMYALLTPVLILLLGLLGLGFGMIISSMTTKYRDLIFLLTFGIQLAMYATPVIYPMSSIGPKYKWLIAANPMTGIIETFRYGFLGSGSFSWMALGYSCIFAFAITLLGILTFNKVEKSFMDTV